MPDNITAFIEVKEDKFLKKIDVHLRLLNNIFSASIFDQIARKLIQGGSLFNETFYQKIGKFKQNVISCLTKSYNFQRHEALESMLLWRDQ